EVARHLPSYAWVLLLVQVVILAAAAAVGAFFGEYLKTRGKNLATKADFDSLQDQLRANTELVETIKAEVGQKDWAQREWTNLRRTKLEALLEKMHDCETYLHELGNEIYRFSQKCRELVMIAMDHAIAVSQVRVGADLDAYRTAHGTFRE